MTDLMKIPVHDSQLRAAKAWRQRNRARVRAYNQAYYRANKEKIRSVQKIWSEKNYERMKEYRKAYHSSDPMAVAAFHQKKEAAIEAQIAASPIPHDLYAPFSPAIEAALDASDPHRVWFYQEHGEQLGRMRDRDRMMAGQVPGIDLHAFENSGWKRRDRSKDKTRMNGWGEIIKNP